MSILPGARSLLSKILLLLTSIGLMTVLCEVVVRSLNRFNPPTRLEEIDRAPYYMADPDFGFKLRPEMNFDLEYPAGITKTIRSNPQGFRGNRDLLSSDPRPKVLLLGDSFTFGLGVGESERFSFVLQSMKLEWRVDDLGMNGFGPDLMIMALETYLPDIAPNLVCMVIYTDDMRRVKPFFAGLGFPLPRFSITGERLKKVSYPRYYPWDALHVVQLLRHVAWKVGKKEDKLNRAIIERFSRLARKYSFMPAIVFLPGYWMENENDHRRRDLLHGIAELHQIPFLDLGPILTSDRRRFFYPGDIHLNPLGHEVVAMALKQFLVPLVPNDPLTPQSH